MKKLLNLFLTAMMLCSMLATATVPALAAVKEGVGVIDITYANQLSSELSNLTDGRTVVFNLKTDMCIEGIAEIKADNCSILIRADDIYYSKYGDVKIYPNYTTNHPAYHFLNIKGDNVKLYFDGRVICKDFKSGSGGCINIDSENCVVANGRFYNCEAQSGGGAIRVVDDNVTIKDCTFENCRAPEGPGGAIVVRDDNYDESNECKIYQCTFKGNSCENIDREAGGGWFPSRSFHYGDDVQGRGGVYSETDTTIQNCTSDSTNADHFYFCIVLPDTERTPMDTGADIFGTEFSNGYTQPMISDYTYSVTNSDEQCDVIRPNQKDTVESEKGYFTLEGTNFYGAAWKITDENPLTITAKAGYTITRIEAVVRDNLYYNDLLSDKGTKGDIIDNPKYSGKELEKDYIASFNDINDKSVTFTTQGDAYNHKETIFKDIIVYYTVDSTLGSVFSGGTLWLIIGVAAVAVAAAVVIVVVKKKKNPVAADGKAVENAEEDDE